MQSGINGVIPRLGTVVVCCLGVSLPCLAAPPVSKATPPARALPAAETFHLSEGTHASSLDLRPPAVSELAKFIPAVETVRHVTGSQGDEYAREDETAYPAAMRTAAAQARVVSRAQAFADRFHREGLPIARLWENHSALVSLGLNQKGKPGLWLVQKTH